MGVGEERDRAGGSGERRITYCVVPYELAPKLHEALRRHFREAPDVDVVVEHRRRDRRSGAERRTGDEGPPAAGERRLIRSTSGRRIADRRAVQLETAARPLPRRAARYAEQIAFFERLEPSTQEEEDRGTARLVMRFQAGEREPAFTEIYRRYFDRVYAYLRVAFRSSHEAEDATQQVFVTVFEKLGGYERRSQPFRAWLFAIVRNYAVSQLRKQARLEVVSPDEIGEHRRGEAVAEIDPQIMSWITDRDLSVLMERLPLAQRQALLLRFGFGMHSNEVAAILGREPSDIRMLQHRALEFLRARLAAFRAAGEPTAAERRRNRSSRRPVRRAEVMRARRYALM